MPALVSTQPDRFASANCMGRPRPVFGKMVAGAGAAGELESFGEAGLSLFAVIRGDGAEQLLASANEMSHAYFTPTRKAELYHLDKEQVHGDVD